MFYYLKHRNDTVALLSIEDDSDHLTDMEIIQENKHWLPFLGNADHKRMARWIRNRSIPSTRDQIEILLREAGCRTTTEYLFKNLGLSVTDSYWIAPVEMNLKWEEVSPFRSFSGRKMPIHNDSSYSPNASLGGQLSKYIDLDTEPPQLIKRTTAYNGLQCLNEVIASRTHARQNRFPYVQYQAKYDPSTGFYICECALFTQETVEFIPAYEVILSEKKPNDLSDYDFYIRLCEQHGILQARSFMDYMTLSDFVLSNADRHLYNFGILRSSETGLFLGMAPLFDTGNSMFYDQIHSRAMTRVELLEQEITAFHNMEEKMLRHITDRAVFTEELAVPPDLIRRFYIGAHVPENTAEVIASNYSEKLKMLREFQRGDTISLFTEKKKQKSVPEQKTQTAELIQPDF